MFVPLIVFVGDVCLQGDKQGVTDGFTDDSYSFLAAKQQLYILESHSLTH